MEPNVLSAIAAAASAGISAIALIATGIQLYYFRRQIGQDFDWKRRERAMQYSQVNHPDVREARARLSKKLGNLETRIPWDTLKKKIEKDRTISDDLRTILIYLENMGLAVRHNVADFRIIYDMNGTDIIRFHDIFKEYIDVTRGGNNRIWQNVEDLAERLRKERSAENDLGALKRND